MRSTIRTWLSMAATFVLATGPAAAQDQASPPPAKVDSSRLQTGHKHLFGRRDVFVAGAFAATTVMLFPLDRQLAKNLGRDSSEANNFLENAASGVEFIASPGAYYIGGGLYLVGQAMRSRKVTDLGWHGAEAVILGETISMLLKGTLGRQRPFVDVESPREFGFGRGFRESKWRSFPSGHTTTAFAAASAVTDETTRWWPESTWIVGPVMYGGATLVGLSRMYHNRHWASDIALGALIGTFSGKKVVLASHSNPNNVIDRFMLGGFVSPSRFGTWNVGWGAGW